MIPDIAARFTTDVPAIQANTREEPIRAEVSSDLSRQLAYTTLDIASLALQVDAKGNIKSGTRADGSKIGNPSAEICFLSFDDAYSQHLLSHCYSGTGNCLSLVKFDDEFGGLAKLRTSTMREFGDQLAQLIKDKGVIDLGCGNKFLSFQVRLLSELWGARNYLGIDVVSAQQVLRDEFGTANNFTSVLLKDNFIDFLKAYRPSSSPKVFVLLGLESWREQKGLNDFARLLYDRMQPNDYILTDMLEESPTGLHLAKHGFTRVFDDYQPRPEHTTSDDIKYNTCYRVYQKTKSPSQKVPDARLASSEKPELTTRQ